MIYKSRKKGTYIYQLISIIVGRSSQLYKYTSDNMINAYMGKANIELERQHRYLNSFDVIALVFPQKSVIGKTP